MLKNLVSVANYQEHWTTSTNDGYCIGLDTLEGFITSVNMQVPMQVPMWITSWYPNCMGRTLRM